MYLLLLNTLLCLDFVCMCCPVSQNASATTSEWMDARRNSDLDSNIVYKSTLGKALQIHSFTCHQIALYLFVLVQSHNRSRNGEPKDQLPESNPNMRAYAKNNKTNSTAAKSYTKYTPPPLLHAQFHPRPLEFPLLHHFTGPLLSPPFSLRNSCPFVNAPTLPTASIP